MKNKVIALMISLAMIIGALSPVAAAGAYAADEDNTAEAESYTFGNLYEGEIESGKHDKDFAITLDKAQHVYIEVSSAQQLTLGIYNSSGSCVSSESNSIARELDNKTHYISHSCNLEPGTYTVKLTKRLRLLPCTISFVAYAEDVISVSTPQIKELSSPEAGTAKVVCDPASGALVYEYQYSKTSDFSSAGTAAGTQDAGASDSGIPVTVTSAPDANGVPECTVSGLEPGSVYYFRVRASNTYGDGKNVYSGWSRIQAVTVQKNSNKVTISTKAKTVKRSKLKKNKKQTFSVAAKDKAGAALTWSVKSAPKKAKKYISINKSTGKMTVKKGIKKGKYTVKVKVMAAETAEYKAASKTRTIKITVK